MRILVVRLGAMGDVIHALPAVASLRRSFPHARIEWAIEPRWASLLENNPHVDCVLALNPRSWTGLGSAWRTMREERYDFAVDLQGLLKSALVAGASWARETAGYHTSQLRERAATLFYSIHLKAQSAHIVDRHLELAAACGATTQVKEFPLPAGKPEGELPPGGFVLASPFAGWPAKEWPLENYARLGELLERKTGLRLVLDGPPASEAVLRGASHVVARVSSIPGLIHATRQARAVVGVDSGPLHLAAALGKRGVAIFGPTNPARNGPYGGVMRVLRSENAITSYRRRKTPDPGMLAITPETVLESLEL
ncbi:MAG: glycosyltransferase family 9 protein [Acidobacteria bacterium]|nr:glycosyltransferase family 9 protein [Acidobacteriota bacterium]